MKRWQFIAPLALFAVLLGFLAVGLNLNPREVPSPLIGKPAPAFSLPRLDDPGTKIGREDLLGKVWILNVWASWCVACREEHPLLVAFSRRKLVPIYGLNYKDGRAEAQRWLANFGDPYTASISDADGRVGIDFGVYGVPETFVIDKQGTVRFKQIGPITPEALRDKIEPLLKQLQAENAAANPA
jgi:cytochrome c biogenesis protein CcmG, thiol:disulfide interchange protein DsbE